MRRPAHVGGGEATVGGDRPGPPVAPAKRPRRRPPVRSWRGPLPPSRSTAPRRRMVRRARRRSVGVDTAVGGVGGDRGPPRRTGTRSRSLRRRLRRRPSQSPKGPRSRTLRGPARARRRSAGGAAAGARPRSPARPKARRRLKGPTSPNRPTRAPRPPTGNSPNPVRHGEGPGVRGRLDPRPARRPGRRIPRPTPPLRPSPRRSRRGRPGDGRDARRSSRPTRSWPDPLAFAEGDRPSAGGVGSPRSPRRGSPTS